MINKDSKSNPIKRPNHTKIKFVYNEESKPDLLQEYKYENVS